MDYINGISIKKLQESLESARNVIELAKGRIKYWNKCTCENKNECIRCTTNQLTNQLTNHIQSLYTLLPNTIYFPLYVDAYALKEALENFGSPIDSVELNPMYNNETAEWNENDELNKPDYYQLVIYYSRYAMDGNGYHVGYENVQFTINCTFKQELGLYGIPYLLSELVVNPNNIQIKSKELPPEDLPTIDSHDSNCNVFKRDEGNEWNPDNDPFPDDCDCNCNDMWNGYYPPDDDFFYGEIDCLISSIFQSNQLPEAEFDPKSRTWSIGSQVEYKMDDVF